MFELKSILHLNHSLALTPELRQALKILALDDQELHDMASEELTSNVALEECDERVDEVSFDHWRSFSDLTTSAMAWDNLQSAPASLWESLQEQLAQSSFNVLEVEIGNRLIQDVDQTGYFLGSTEEIANELFVPDSWVESVRKRMLAFEPVGCLAKSLNECLLAQALQTSPKPSTTLLRILSLGLLENAIKDTKQTAKQLGYTRSEVSSALQELSRFKRQPARSFEDQDEPILSTLPHVEVTDVDGRLKVTNLRSMASSLRIKKMPIVKHSKDERLNSFIKQSTQRATGFLNAITRREHTIVRVVEAITRYQHKWFYCIEPLSALTMKQIATDLDIHESTVSRSVANKLLRCERGTFAVRSFFVSQVTSSSVHESHSSDAIKATILQLISKEDRKNPLSDEQIYRTMCENQLFVARRTIAKYRNQLKIATRSQRKTAF